MPPTLGNGEIWSLGRPASPTPGLLVYIMVDDMPATRCACP